MSPSAIPPASGSAAARIPNLLRVEAVARILSVSRRQVLRLIQRGHLERIALSARCTRISSVSLSRFIARCRRGRIAPTAPAVPTDDRSLNPAWVRRRRVPEAARAGALAAPIE